MVKPISLKHLSPGSRSNKKLCSFGDNRASLRQLISTFFFFLLRVQPPGEPLTPWAAGESGPPSEKVGVSTWPWDPRTSEHKSWCFTRMEAQPICPASPPHCPRVWHQWAEPGSPGGPQDPGSATFLMTWICHLVWGSMGPSFLGKCGCVWHRQIQCPDHTCPRKTWAPGIQGSSCRRRLRPFLSGTRKQEKGAEERDSGSWPRFAREAPFEAQGLPTSWRGLLQEGLLRAFKMPQGHP